MSDNQIKSMGGMLAPVGNIDSDIKVINQVPITCYKIA